MTKRIGVFSAQPICGMEEVRQIEKRLFDMEDSFSVMQRAANTLYKHIATNQPNAQHFIIVVGSGNNGGDGLLLAQRLKQAGMSVVVLDCAKNNRKGDALKAYEIAQSADVVIEPFDPERQYSVGVVVDGVLGIGGRLPLNESVLSAVSWINHAKQVGAYVVAIDIPTGVNANTGHANECVYADLTVSMVQRKIGNMIGRGGIASGCLVNETLGSNTLWSDLQRAEGGIVNKVYWLDVQQLMQTKPCPRYIDGHKGCYGHVAVFGGDHGYGGAAIMASEAASKAGAGTVGLVTRGEHISAALTRNPNVMAFDVENTQVMDLAIRNNTIVVLGPGLGRGSWGERMFHRVMALSLPTVLDADGLFWLSQNADVHLPEGSIITPHLGEASRLLGWSIDDIHRSPIEACLTMSRKYSCTAILKGVTSVIANYDGTVYITGKSEPVLSKGGSGDVLSGMVGAAMAYYRMPLEAAVIATAWHNYAAGEVAKQLGEHRAQPYDLLDYLE